MSFTVHYALVQFFFWFVYGTVVNFSSVYLLACGLSNTAFGALSALASLLSVLLQPVLAARIDRRGKLSVKGLLLISSLLLTALGLGLIPAYGPRPWLNAALLGGAILLAQVMLPFVNALATQAINRGENLNFSAARGFGSVGYAVMSFSVGRLTARFGAGCEPMIIAVVALCLLLVCLRFPKEKDHSVLPSADNRNGDRSILDFFRGYRSFMLTLIGCVLLYTSHVLINSFIYQIVVHKGGNTEHMGIVMGAAGLLELSAMFGYGLLLRWKENRFWFRLAGIFFTLKCLGTLLAGSMGGLYAVQLLQPLGWGLMSVSCVYYADSVMRKQDKVKGQACMAMTLSIGTIVGTLIGGWLIDRTGVPGMLTAAIAAGALGTVIVMNSTRDAISNPT